MPIRHCQKCGLKVLIDESQTASNPFYCQRCTASMKSDAAIGAIGTPPRRLTPAATPSPAAVAAAAATTVKVFCPYCKASFNGRIPQKPARGQCPLCQKDLILLPSGDIRPAAGFDPSQWQKSGAASSKPPELVEETPKESGTRMLVKKFAADPGAAVARGEAGSRVLADPAPAPPQETPSGDGGQPPLPDWLDDAPKAPSPAPAAAQAASETAEAEPVKLEDLPDAEPPPPPPRKVASRTMPVAPPPPPPAAAKRSGATGVQKKVTERRVPSGSSHPAVPTGAGKFVLALLLALLPVVACPVLLTLREGFKGSIVEKIGTLFAKGFQALDRRLFPVAEAAPAPPEEKKAAPPPEAPAKPTAEDQRQMEEEINKRWMEYKREERTVKQLSVGATEAQKADIQKAQADLQQKQQRIDELRANYRKIFGKDYDPTKQ
ncbi:MAG TPA: hypothetical protein VEJ18_11765 [Planctomycetota bacterium]|nr:hypothetical protein [Planctomycetota bacterium]